MKPPAAATSRALFLFAKKVVVRLKSKVKQGHTEQIPMPPPGSSDFRETMVEMHRRWYETEADWQNFLGAVRKRNQAEISEKLLDAAVAMFELAVATYQGPLSYEASLTPTNMKSLLEQGECSECGSQGDIDAILPHPKTPQWKLRCPECGHTWHTVDTEESI